MLVGRRNTKIWFSRSIYNCKNIQKLALWATILLLQQHIGCASVKRRVLNQFSLEKAKKPHWQGLGQNQVLPLQNRNFFTIKCGYHGKCFTLVNSYCGVQIFPLLVCVMSCINFAVLNISSPCIHFNHIVSSMLSNDMSKGCFTKARRTT